jgi:hypothetical protein
MESLDSEILASLAALRHCINSLQSSLYHLPPGVFSEIASHLQCEIDVINLTHVSHHLRATLLSRPNLWSYIDVRSHHQEQARAFLERSKQAPLRVNLVTRETENFALLRSHVARIVSLEVYNSTYQRRNVFSQPMPALRRLEIVGNYPYNCKGEEDEEDEEELDWRPMENAWSLPSVTLLIVKHVGDILLHVPHLTHFMFRDGKGLTTVDQLLEFLDNCPLLEHVDISYLTESSSSRSQLISLPNLRTYTQPMYDEHYTLGLFNMLSLPPSCSVTSQRFSKSSDVKAADIVLLSKIRIIWPE